MKVLINYANEKYRKTQKFNTWTGRYIAGFDKVYSFTPNDIDEQFYQKNKSILDYKRGIGLWLWKPYVILKVMENVNDGDIIFYCDSGAFFIRKIDSLLSTIDKKKQIWVSDIPLIEKNFTKYNCFKLMDCLGEKYKNTNQIQATFFIAVNSKKSRKFVEKWLTFCEDERLILPATEIDQNPELVSHREDQSILSLLCKKNHIEPHLDPSQRGKYPKWYKKDDYQYKLTQHSDNYRPVVFLHKTPNVNIINILKQFIKCILRL